MGTKLYIQTKPTFPGAKAPVLKKVPYTADNPTVPQLKARLWLAQKAVSLTNTFGATGNTGKGKGGPKVALEIFKAKPGVGTHGGKSLRGYAEARRKGEAGVATIRAQLEAKAGAGA